MRTESRDREIALRYVYRCDARGELSSDTDDYRDFMNHFGNRGDSTFCQKLCLGTLKNVEKIDKVIDAYALNWKISRMAKVDRALLRVGTYELTVLSTPFKVVIDEAIELAGRYGSSGSKAFVNGILHGIAHEFTHRHRTGNN